MTLIIQNCQPEIKFLSSDCSPEMLWLGTGNIFGNKQFHNGVGQKVIEHLNWSDSNQLKDPDW